MSDHKKRVQSIALSDKSLAERAKDLVEYFETVEADNVYFSFNSARNTGSQTATVTVSNTDGTSEMFTVDF